MTQEEINKYNPMIAKSLSDIKNRRLITSDIKTFFKQGHSIDASGIVKMKNGKAKKIHPGSSGYLQVNISINRKTRSILIHRLLAIAFIHNKRNAPEVNHKNGNKFDNSIENLEWVTRSENMRHGFDNGLIRKSMIGRIGYKHWRAKLIIRKLPDGSIEKYEGSGDASRKTGLDRGAILDACSGKLKTYKNSVWSFGKREQGAQK